MVNSQINNNNTVSIDVELAASKPVNTLQNHRGEKFLFVNFRRLDFNNGPKGPPAVAFWRINCSSTKIIAPANQFNEPYNESDDSLEKFSAIVEKEYKNYRKSKNDGKAENAENEEYIVEKRIVKCSSCLLNEGKYEVSVEMDDNHDPEMMNNKTE